MSLENLTIKKAREMLDKGELTAVDLAKYYLKNIEEKNSDLNAYLEVYDDVLDQAKRADEIIKHGEQQTLTGIPIALKDNLLVKGRKASAASKILEDYTCTYTATAVQKLIDQGAVLLGRTNMDEFAMGGSTENSAYGVTKNPHDTDRVAGGSSGGSAAALAARLCLAALGSDTGGSVREPASFCGVVGLKPTYGSVSRYGLMAMGSSLDVIGTFTHDIGDAKILFDVIRGKDKMDSTSIEARSTKHETQNLKIGVPRELLNTKGIDPEVKKNFDESVVKLKKLGYEVVDVELNNIDKALAVYYILMPAEVSSNMARYDGIKYGASVEADNLLDVYKKTRGEKLGREVRRRIILGTYVLSTGYYDAFYGKALIARRVIREELQKAFNNVDAILMPTAPTPAWKIGEKSSPLEEYLADIFTVTANITGMPAISIPSGVVNVDGKDLPLGLQLIAPELSEEILFEIGKKFLGE